MKNILFLALAWVVILFSQPVNSNVRSDGYTFSTGGQHFLKSIDNVCHTLTSSVKSLDNKGRSVLRSEEGSELKSDVLSAIRPEMAKIGVELLPCDAGKTAGSDMARLILRLTVREYKTATFKFRYDLHFRLDESVRNKESDEMSSLPVFYAKYFSHEESLQEALTALVNKAAEYTEWSSVKIKEAKAN